jgi:hypothetical protein
LSQVEDLADTIRATARGRGVADRYEVPSEPRSAERGRGLLTRLALGSPAY